MRYLKKFNESKELDLYRMEYGIIGTYVINSDGSVDVNGSVDLKNRDLTELPVKYGKVSGSFNCSYNKLTSLKGCPNTCKWIDCSVNNLYNLYFVGETTDGIEFSGNPIDEVFEVCDVVVYDHVEEDEDIDETIELHKKFIKYMQEFRPIRGNQILLKRLKECLYMCDLSEDVEVEFLKQYEILE